MCALLPGPKVMKLADLVAQFTKAVTQNDVQVVVAHRQRGQLTAPQHAEETHDQPTRRLRAL